jgi:hypothetical protein
MTVVLRSRRPGAKPVAQGHNSRKIEAQRLRRFVSIDEKPNPSE